jgi:hypothetical protein
VFSDKKPSILASDGRLDGDDRDFLFDNFLYHKDKELALGFRLPAFLDELVLEIKGQRFAPSSDEPLRNE